MTIMPDANRLMFVFSKNIVRYSVWVTAKNVSHACPLSLQQCEENKRVETSLQVVNRKSQTPLYCETRHLQPATLFFCISS